MADATAIRARMTWLRDLHLPIMRTPLAVVDLDRIGEGVDLVRRSAPTSRVTYALKASYHAPLVRSIQRAGAGVSVFSELELALARRAGFLPADIIYNGVARSGSSLHQALQAGVQVNVESFDELNALLQARAGTARPGAIGLRVNAAHHPSPDEASKYQVLGLAREDLTRAADLIARTSLRINGIAFHLFQNQVTNRLHRRYLRSLLPALEELAAHPAADLTFVDVGGGFASRLEIGDTQAEEAFAGIGADICGALDAVPVFELGRFLVADAQMVISRVVAVRTTPTGERTVLLDATTNYLIPAPGHRFWVEPLAGGATDTRRPAVTFIDRLGSAISRQPAGHLTVGDLVAILNCGAYTDVLKERFVYPLPPVAAISDGACVSVAPGGGDTDVAAYHHWPGTAQAPQAVAR
ncbi:diaminopimelate decarboxylase family protein [Streptomyces variabilis]